MGILLIERRLDPYFEQSLLEEIHSVALVKNDKIIKEQERELMENFSCSLLSHLKTAGLAKVSVNV